MIGTFITVEGPDGSGKTTQMQLLASRLKDSGYDVVATREPGGTKLGEKVRELLLDPRQTELSSRAEILLYAAARAQHVSEVIKPALEAGKLVLCDRYTDSTIAYQGFGRGLDLAFIEAVNNQATGGLAPHMTLLFDLPAAEGLKRANAGRNPDRMEAQEEEFHEKVRQGFLWLNEEQPERIYLLDAAKTVAVLADEVWEIISRRLASGN